MASKPDRFEHAVWDCIQDGAGFIQIVDPQDAVLLLRHEHASVVRAVKKIRQNSKASFMPKQLGIYLSACDDILAMLKKRKMT